MAPARTRRSSRPSRARCARTCLRARRGVGDFGPARLGRELDDLVVAVGLGVAEAVRALVEDDLELALHHALVEPRAAEDEPPQPVHHGALGGAHEAGPAAVDVLAETRVGLGDLAVNGEVDQILAL